MAFYLESFDGVDLPLQNATWDFSTPMSPSLLIPTLNGSIDFYGTRRRIQHSQIFEVDARVDATTVAGMADNIREIESLVGHTGWLVRSEVDGTNSLRRYCRLLGVNFVPQATQRGVVNKLALRFETNQPFWYSSSTTTHTATISSGTPFAITVAGEEDVINPVITITAVTTISSVIIEHSKTEAGETIQSDIRYSTSLSSTDVLIIDCGAYTVTDNGAVAYSGFSLGTAHDEKYWMRWPAGSQTIEITLGSGSGTYKFEYNAAYR